MKLFITGGAGFIGSNAANFFLKRGHKVTVFDNLSRPGAESNLDWLRANHAFDVDFIKGDVKDYDALASSVHGSDLILHLAGQVAVTTSVQDPRADFESNALGTFNILEATRHFAPQATLIYASTNKVYGGLKGLVFEEGQDRYLLTNMALGVPESFPLDFRSPYGCSKGSGDQYAVDYARIYGLRTVVFRQSCVYGPRQFGFEDQGWIAHFLISALLNRPITVYGNGKQVRDLLHVDDLLHAYKAAARQIDDVRGEVFNIGGGPQFSLSIWCEFSSILERITGEPTPVASGEWRPGDQKVFIADISKARDLLGWQPRISPEEGIQALYRWLAENRSLVQRVVSEVSGVGPG